MSASDRVTGWPTAMAESRPMYIWPRFFTLFWMKLEAASEMGSRPSMSREAIRGMSTSTAPSVTPQVRMLVMEPAMSEPSK